MEIKASSIHNFNTIRDFLHMGMFKKNNPKHGIILVSILYSFVILCILFSLFAFGYDLRFVILLVVSILMLVFFYTLYFIAPIVNYNSLAKMKDCKNIYIFGDEFIKSSTESPHYTDNEEIKYSLFFKAYETSKYIYLYRTKVQVYIVEKATIEGGTIEELRAKLVSYLEENYITCNY